MPSANTGTTIGAGAASIDNGDVTSIFANVPLNVPFAIDVVVDQVPVTGLSGIGGELKFNGVVVRVVNPVQTSVVPVLHSQVTVGRALHRLRCTPPGRTPLVAGASTPFDLSGCDESGPGTVIRITLECLTVGSSAIGLTDTSTGGNAMIGILGGPNGVYNVITEQEAAVHDRPSGGWSRFGAGWG